MLRNKKFLQKGVGLSKLINFRTVSNYLKKTRVIVNIFVCIYRKYDDLRKNMNAYSNCNNSLSVGDIIKFGNYYINDSKNKEPIEWRVLEVSNNKALLITKDAIDCKPYNNEWRYIKCRDITWGEYSLRQWRDTTWGECSLRQWLNNEFINQAFSKEEQNEIILTNISNPNNPYFEKWGGNNSWGGNNTKDKIFLLSIDEALKYFKHSFIARFFYGDCGALEDRACKVTSYARQQGAWTSDKKEYLGNCRWWLRSLGCCLLHCNAAVVYYDGSLGYTGYDVDDRDNAVRPALFINL